MDLSQFEAIDWDEEDDESGNLAHCLRHGVDELVVEEVLRGTPAQVRMNVDTAGFAVVGPDDGGRFWTLLFDVSYKRDDWLRPITGWRSTNSEMREWERARKV